MSRVLIFIGAVLACVLTGLIVIPRLVDWNHYRGMLEAEASRLLGRRVSVHGEVNLRLLPTPYIQFDDVRVSDAREGRAPIFKADGFTVWLAPGPLFRGALEASRVELIRPVLTLVTEKSGSGNWASLGTGGARPVYAPSSISLRAVRITDGRIVLQTPEGDERTRLGIASGEFSAASLEGPYKLQAMLEQTAGQPAREVRLSTAKPEADGSVRFKGTMRSPDTRETFAFDGQLLDLTGRTRVVGELTAALPLPGTPKTAPQGGGGGEHHGFDLRATLEADTKGLALTALSLSFDNDGRPQLVTGEARLAWQDASSSIRLDSRWLDLDRIAGRDANTAPLRLLATLAAGLDGMMPSTGRTDATFALDQATLGGDVVSGLRFEIAKEGGSLRLKGLHAGLPGGTRFQAAGTLVRQNDDMGFDGTVTVRGASLNRLLGWARRGQDLPELRQDGSFTMRGQVSLGANRFAGRKMILQLAGNTLSADVSWSGGQGKRQLTVFAEGPELDVGPSLGSKLELPALADLLLQHSTADAQAPAKGRNASASAPPAQQIESTLQVRVGRLVSGPLSLRDVVADLAIDQDSLKVSLLKFSSDEGYNAEFSGAVTGLAGNSPKGSIGGNVSATRAAGVVRLAEVLGLPQTLRPSTRRAATLGPLRMAGTLTVGARGAPTLDLALDGMLAGSRLTGRALLESLNTPWREQRIDVMATLDGQESTLLSQILPDTLAESAEKTATTPARTVLRAVGVPTRNLATLVSFDAAGLSGNYRGRIVLDADGITAGEGESQLAAEDLGRAAALLGIASRGGLEGIAAEAHLGGKLEAGRLHIDAAEVSLGDASLAGSLELALKGERPRLTGELHASAISAPRLIAMAAHASGEQKPQEGSPVRPSPWPDGALELKRLDTLDADVRIEAPAMTIVPDVTVSEAKAQVQVAGGRATFKLQEGRGLAGKASGHVTISRAPAGISLEGEARLMNAALEAFVSGDRPAATGEFSVELGFSSVALSPRGLITAMRGKGAITLGDTRLYRMGPGAVNAAALGALAAPAEGLNAELRRRLLEGLAIGAQPLGPRRIDMELTDGVLRMEPLTLETTEGRVTASTTIDLDTLKFDSEWRIEPRPLGPRAAPGRTALPGVSMVYVGPLSRLGAVEPRLESAALERELGVRKMERYVDELERLRRLDEESARQEAERQRNLEIERQRLEMERQNMLRRSAIETPARLSQPTTGGIVPNVSTATPVETAQPNSDPAAPGSVSGGGAGPGTAGASTGGSAAAGGAVEVRRLPQPQARPRRDYLNYYGDTRP